MKITIDASTSEGLQALQALVNMVDNSEPDFENEEDIQFDPEEIMRLAGYGTTNISPVSQDCNIENESSLLINQDEDVSEEETLNHDINKVNDGDSDGRGYEYGDDAYNLFGAEKQKLRYVPARSGDNALQEKSFSKYFTEVQRKNG